MSGKEEIVLTVQDLAASPSRSLYAIAASIKRVSSTSLIVQRGHVDMPAIASEGAVQRVLHEEDLVHGIIEELVESCTHGDYRSPGTSKHLLQAALTCKDWFHPAISALWSTFSDLPALVHLLIPASLHGVHNTPKAQFKYIWTTYCANPVRGRLHRQFLIFRFYAGCIQTLRMSGTDFSTAVFSQLARIHDADILLPALRNVGWSDDMADISNSALRTFGLVARSPLLSSLVVGVINPSQDVDAKARILQQTCTLLEKAASYAPELTTLTVVGPNGVALPIAFLAAFKMLAHVNIQIDLDVPEYLALPSPSEANSAGHGLPLQTLFLSWSVATNLVFITHVANFSYLRSLTVMADDHPPTMFLEQIVELGTYTTSALSQLRIVAGVHFPITIDGIDLARLVAPFLRCFAMEEVSIELPSFSMDFVVGDIQQMLHAWPHIISLEITFCISDPYNLPDLRELVRHAPRMCPNLTVLHLPAIATYANMGEHFKLKVPSSPYRFFFSSELIFTEHHPLDVAYYLVKAFGYNPIRPNYIPGTFWTTIDTLVEAILERDRGTVVRYGLADWWFPWGRITTATRDICLRELDQESDVEVAQPVE